MCRKVITNCHDGGRKLSHGRCFGRCYVYTIVFLATFLSLPTILESDTSVTDHRERTGLKFAPSIVYSGCTMIRVGWIKTDYPIIVRLDYSKCAYVFGFHGDTKTIRGSCIVRSVSSPKWTMAVALLILLIHYNRY